MSPTDRQLMQNTTNIIPKSGNHLSSLDVSNAYLENYMNKIIVDVGGLERDLGLLELRVKNFHHPIRDTWEANILTRLIEVAHAKQTRKLPPGVAMREASTAERDILSRAYHVASKRVTLDTILKLGLTAEYYEALQRYPEVYPTSFPLCREERARPLILPSG